MEVFRRSQEPITISGIDFDGTSGWIQGGVSNKIVVKKFNASLLSPLVSIYENERPVDWSKQFGRKGPMIVEIGSGLGEFIVHRAEQFPKQNFVGIEYDWPRVYKTLRRISRFNIKNVRLLNVDARVVFERLFLPVTIDSVVALFPCPWPKRSHIKHRLFNREFLQLINSRLADHGELKIVTDFYPYLEWISDEIPAQAFRYSERKIPPQFDTKFERRWQGQGQNEFWELLLTKQSSVAIPLKEDIILKEFSISHFNAQSLTLVDEKKDAVILFKEHFFDSRKSRAMIHAIVVEKNLTQHFWIAVVKQSDHWMIRPLEGCLFIPTPGIQRALELVREQSSIS